MFFIIVICFMMLEMKMFVFLAEKIGDGFPLTGGAWDFRKSTISLAPYPLDSPKKVTFVRHGLSSWNLESRVQVCCFLSGSFFIVVIHLRMRCFRFVLIVLDQRISFNTNLFACVSQLPHHCTSWMKSFRK